MNAVMVIFDKLEIVSKTKKNCFFFQSIIIVPNVIGKWQPATIGNDLVKVNMEPIFGMAAE